jgi:hypothetical protein
MYRKSGDKSPYDLIDKSFRGIHLVVTNLVTALRDKDE